MSGKALFTYDPTLFQDDEDAVDDNAYEEDSGDEATQASGKQQVEEKKEERKVDEALFQDDGADEDIDFD